MGPIFGSLERFKDSLSLIKSEMIESFACSASRSVIALQHLFVVVDDIGKGIGITVLSAVGSNFGESMSDGKFI